MPVELQVIRASEFVCLDAGEQLDFEASKKALQSLAHACRKRGSVNPKAKIILFVWLLAFVTQGRAQEFSAEELTHRALERRAIEAVVWGMPAANFDLMYQAMIRDAVANDAN